MRLKTGKTDYCKAEGLDNLKSIDAFALVDSIVLQAFETGLRIELQEVVKLRQDDYDNLDEALEIAQTIESGLIMKKIDILLGATRIEMVKRNYHGAFNSHQGSQFSGGRSDLALFSPSRNNYGGRFESQRGRNSNRSQQQIGRGRGRMRGQNSYRGIPAPERRNVRFQKNHREAGFMAENYDDPRSPFNRFEDIANINEDLSSPLDGSLNLNARSFLQEQQFFSLQQKKNHHYILKLSNTPIIGFLFRISTIVGTLEKFLGEFLGYFQEIDDNSLNQAFPLEEFWKEGDLILAAYKNSENTSKIEEQIDKVKLDHLDQKLKEKLRRLLEMYGRMFAQSTYDVGQNNTMEEEIDINPDVPIHKVKQFNLPLLQQKALESHVQALLKAGIIKPGRRPYQSPVFIIAKTVNGVIPERSQLDVTNSIFLNDVRHVNQAIHRSVWPLTRADDIFSTLGLSGARFISIIDVSHGFYNVNLHEKSEKYISFSFRVTGQQMIFQRLPQGASPSPQIFQEFMSILFEGMQSFVRFYIDDLVIFSQSEDEHLSHLEKKVSLLGFIIISEGVKPKESKIREIVQLKPPRNIKELRVSDSQDFTEDFVLNYAKLTSCFTRLLRKDTKWEWEEEQQSCFNLLKEELSKSVFLKFPYHDGRPYYIITDSSKDVSASALLQKDDDNRW
ncbi:hypothetical protein QYM36_019487 [Artemia franciscana]|uniref:Reverse transcriptase domain-containing protein n=1 Tax=Artemia franciscana TaxID=6661 RepID=A0AA88H7U5_ARTSF|nr:hypothetical protein QYM36_019487 [Artemia franciscana]